MAKADPNLARIKELRAVQMKSLGATLDEIAASLLPCDDHRDVGGRRDCATCQPMYATRSGAKRALDRALEREYAAGASTREQLRREQLAQIDRLLRPVMQEAVGRGDGRHEAVRNAVRLLDRRARLLGLDAPTRVQVDTELDAQIRAMAEALAEGAVSPSPLS